VAPILFDAREEVKRGYKKKKGVWTFERGFEFQEKKGKDQEPKENLTQKGMQH